MARQWLGPPLPVSVGVTGKSVVVGQELNTEFARAGHDDRVGQSQPVVIGTQPRRSLSHRRRQRSYGDPHRRDGVTGIG